MIHISRTKTNQFIVAVVSDKNGKVIMCSEPLTQKKAAHKNIVALMRGFGEDCIIIQDNALKKPEQQYFNYEGKHWFCPNPTVKPYQPK